MGSSVTSSFLLLRTTALVVACASQTLGCAGYARYIEDQTDTVTTEGRFESKGSGVEPWSFRAQECESGEREGFYGVTFKSSDGRRAVRIVRSAIGPMRVAVASREDPNVYQSLECQAVVGTIRRSGIRVNHIAVLTGELRFVCEGLRGAAIFSCG